MGFFDGAGAGLISGLGSIASGILNSTVGYNQSKGLMRYQAELQQQMLDRANQYNSPQEQMRRLAEAGLNPNLVYGSGVSGNQSESGKVSVANRDAGISSGIPQAVETYLQARALRQSIQESQWRGIESMSRTAVNLQKNKLARATFADTVRQIHENVEHTIQSMEESKQRVLESRQRVRNMTEEVNEIRARVRNTDARTVTEKLRPGEIKAHTKLMKEQSLTTAKQRELYDSIINLNEEKVAQLSVLIEKIGYEKDITAIEADLAKQMKNFGLTGVTPKDLLDYLFKLVRMALIQK